MTPKPSEEGTAPPGPVEKPDLVNGLIVDFLTTDAVPTPAPHRRAAAAPAGS